MNARALVVSLLACVSAWSAGGCAHAQARRLYNIGAGSLINGLEAFAAQSDQAVIYSPQASRNHTTAGFKGEALAGEALGRLLAGTGFTFRTTQGGTLLVTPSPRGDGGGQGLGRSGVGAMGRPELALTQPALSELLVTAQKREEPLQKTPAAIAVESRADLRVAGVDDLSGLPKLVPDLRVTRVVSSSVVSIRGVVAQDVGPTSETPNAVNIDGVYLPRSSGLQGFFFDLDRVEILKGPQGTLYGRNAAGGVLNIVTRKPAEDYEASGLLEIGGSGLLHTVAALNAPVVSGLAIRSAVAATTRDGYADSGLDDARERSARLSGLWRMDETRSLLVTADFERQGGRGPSYALIDALGGTSASQPGAPNSRSSLRDDRAFAGDGSRYRTDATNWGVMAQFDQRLATTILTVQAGRRVHDADNVLARGLPLGSVAHSTSKSNAYSLEARLASISTRPLQWVVGAYMFEEKASGFMDVFPSGTSYTPQASFLNPFQRARSSAIFGQASYSLPWDPRVRLTLGARYTYDHKRADTATRIGEHYTATHGERHWDALTYKAGVAVDFGAAALLYGDVSTGYKAGGFAYGASPEYDPERITAYELGAKGRLLDGRIEYDVDVFYYDYRDYETNFVLQTPTTFQLGVTNAGGARYWGGSFEAQFTASRRDRLRLSLAYTRGVYGDYDLSRTVPTLPDYSNTPIPGIAALSGRISHSHTLLSGARSLDIQTTLRFRSRALMFDYGTNTPNAIFYYDRPWIVGDIALDYRPAGSRWRISAYVRDIGRDMRLSTAVYNDATGEVGASLMPPMTYGLVFSADF